jgi:hypothetical protein
MYERKVFNVLIINIVEGDTHQNFAAFPGAEWWCISGESARRHPLEILIPEFPPILTLPIIAYNQENTRTSLIFMQGWFLQIASCRTRGSVRSARTGVVERRISTVASFFW